MNPLKKETIVFLEKASKKQKAQIWNEVAQTLDKSSRAAKEINVSKLDRMSDKGGSVVVPGKVLGTGDIKHAVTVGAFSFSEEAKGKIEKAGGKAVSIQELVKKNPSGSGIKIVV
jgi:large subunit ribosomal protein L18e